MIKPKIDINVEVMQIKKMLAKVIDAMGIPVPASDMVATPEDLTAMAQGQGSAAGAGGGASSIPPISPIQGASVGGAGGGGGAKQSSVGNSAEALLELYFKNKAK
jgi:hypothetical protein